MTATEKIHSSPSGQLRLSSVLREQTRAAHERAENSPFVGDLMAGKLPISAYIELVVQNHEIYRTLEELAWQWRDDPVAGPFVIDELTRLPSVERDLAALLGPQWRRAAAALVLPATDQYVAHLQEHCADWPVGFIAHHYVRYLGDLSGGQIIRSAVHRIYGDVGVVASSFYVFDEIERIKPFRDRYRHLLDHARLNRREQSELVAEAVVAFELNRGVFGELARSRS